MGYARRHRLFAPHFHLRSWAPGKGARMVARLEAAEPQAIAEVVEALDAVDRAESRAAAGALAAASTPEGFLAATRIARAVVKDKTIPSARLMEGVGGAILANLAARARSTLTAALVASVARAGPEDVEVLESILESRWPGLLDLPEALAAYRRHPDATAAGQALLDEAATRTDQAGWTTQGEVLDDLRRAADRDKLRAYVRDPARLVRDRCRAATILAELGDPSGLVLWESREGLSRRTFADRRRALDDLAARAKGAAAEQARALLDSVWKDVPGR